MAVVTETIRVALREFKAKINSFNFTIDFQEPPHPVGSIQSYEAQLALAKEYLKKFPELNNEEFDHLGTPLNVKKETTRRIRQEKALQKAPRESSNVDTLLWESYMVLDHGNQDERLALLDKLKKHFDTVGKPNLKDD